MKKIIYSIGVLGLIIGTSVRADFVPGRPRPVAKAELHEFDLDGHEVGQNLKKELTLNTFDGSSRKVFTLGEEVPVMCITFPCNPIRVVREFVVTHEQNMPGIGRLYQAVESKLIRDFDRIGLAMRAARLDVFESERTLTREWNVKITEVRVPLVRHLRGEVEAIFTPMDAN